jgi:trehalose 6-phosphate phosphatase
VEPGRHVLELRPPGFDKGAALLGLAESVTPSAVVFVGDDLGDLPAFDAVATLGSRGVPGLRICSGSTEAPALAGRTDLVVEGPAGVHAWIEALLRAVPVRR